MRVGVARRPAPTRLPERGPTAGRPGPRHDPKRYLTRLQRLGAARDLTASRRGARHCELVLSSLYIIHRASGSASVLAVIVPREVATSSTIGEFRGSSLALVVSAVAAPLPLPPIHNSNDSKILDVDVASAARSGDAGSVIPGRASYVRSARGRRSITGVAVVIAVTASARSSVALCISGGN